VVDAGHEHERADARDRRQRHPGGRGPVCTARPTSGDREVDTTERAHRQTPSGQPGEGTGVVRRVHRAGPARGATRRDGDDRHQDDGRGRDPGGQHPDVDPEARSDASALRDRLNVALRELPPRLRAVVVLRDVYDLPHEAIAAELGISESAAKVRLHRARRKLREHLYPLRGEPPQEERGARAV